MKALMDGEYDYTELKKIASTTFTSQMGTTKEVITENSDLYYAIQKFNPFKNNLYDRLEQALKYVIESVLKGNKDDFIKIMKKGKKWVQTTEQD